MAMEKISLKCETCGETHILNKTPELPAHVFFLRCNWCIKCEDRAQDYYDEWWDDNENDGRTPIPDPPDNQLCLPFILDEIGVPVFEGVQGEGL